MKSEKDGETKENPPSLLPFFFSLLFLLPECMKFLCVQNQPEGKEICT
ncbi:MAG: hypothetical protein IKD66_05575 [Solobacterium sp.]|nr:hypothetical protein [Solobacterium sp.]